MNLLSRFTRLIVGVTSLAAVAARTDAATVTLNPARDASLYQSATGDLANGAGEYLFAGAINTGELRRALVWFDVASVVPAGATITSASLTMNMSKSNSGDQPAAIHRVTSSWGEGTSDAPANEGAGTASTTNDATWIHRFYSTTNWATAGGDFSPTVSATQTIGAQLQQYQWASTPQLVADVQNWLVSPAANFGWIILGNEAEPGSAKRFDSGETEGLANRPVLSIEYAVVPEPAAAGLALLATVVACACRTRGHASFAKEQSR